VPASINHKLYNVNNRLYWRGTQLGTIAEGGGWRTEGSIIYPTDLSNRVGISTANLHPEMMLAVHKENDGTNTISPVAHFRTVGDGNSAGAIRLENAEGHHFNIGGRKIRPIHSPLIMNQTSAKIPIFYVSPLKAE